MSKFVNLTPHEITFGINAIPASGQVARVASKPGEELGNGLWTAPQWGEVEGLPAPEPETIYIVSALVAGRVGNTRDDVYSPGTGPADNAVRDPHGRIVGVTRLIRSH
jgi:hypothetical protein